MALGRGLSELLGEVETAYERSTSSAKNGDVISIDIDTISPNPNQPRKVFDEDKLQELAQSIKNYGLLQPISVTKGKDGYILIAGERRLRASKLIGETKIKATLLDANEHKLRELALIENIQRDDLNIIELAYSYAQLINEHSLTHEELSAKIAKSRSSITNTLRLLTLCVYVQQLLGNDKITAGHAKVLIGLSEEDQKKVADSIVGQKLSVRETEQLVKQLKENDSKPVKKTKLKKSFDFSSLNPVLDTLKSEKFKVKVQDDYIKIQINSQEDIDRLVHYFNTKID